MTGLEPNVAVAFADVFAPISGVSLFVLEGEEYDLVRFHSI
jgi:uncharacterized membrane protein